MTRRRGAWLFWRRLLWWLLFWCWLLLRSELTLAGDGVDAVFLPIVFFRLLQHFFGAGSTLRIRMQHVSDQLAQSDGVASRQCALSAWPRNDFAQIGEKVRSPVTPKRHDVPQRPHVRRVGVLLPLQYFGRHVYRRSGHRRRKHVLPHASVQQFGEAKIGEFPNDDGAFLGLGIHRDAKNIIWL